MRFVMGLNAGFLAFLLNVALQSNERFPVQGILIIGALLALNVYHLFTRPVRPLPPPPPAAISESQDEPPESK